MSLSKLTEAEWAVVYECLSCVAQGTVIHHDQEFSSLFGLQVDAYLAIYAQWPGIDDNQESVALAINGAMNNLLGYPHAYHNRWHDVMQTPRDEVERVFAKWRSKPANTTRQTVDTLVWLTHDAYEGDPAHSLIANLKDLHEEDWTAVPLNGGRAIADIIEHVGWCKWMYENYAFGSASLRGDQPPLFVGTGKRSIVELKAWLAQGHQRWIASVRALADDTELDHARLTNRGEHLPTRTIIRIMIAHDLCHAGEINHIRALLQGTDHWRYE